jgi:patatin-related protein
VRVAMALNGGVSLAIWMGGCAVELDAARRARRGPETLGPAGAPPARTVYNGLCKAFDREVVFDLMSGASAGGINGALLSCAITHDRRLHPDFLRDKWLDLGDIEKLLHPTSRPDVRSLLRGKYFYEELEKTFEALIATPDPTAFDHSALPDSQGGHTDHEAQVPLLDITTTDIKGVERLYADDWGGTLVAREHRARFKFREPGDYSATKLARAARSSASFPFAFEPWAIAGDAIGAPTDPENPQPRLVIDGGLLDNAPIKAVLDLIPESAAERQVKRYVCYLNADPAIPEKLSDALASPDDPEGVTPDDELKPFALAKVCVGLPRKAPFVDHLNAIERAVSRSKLVKSTEVTLLVAPDEQLDALARTLLPVYRERRRVVSLEEILGQSPTVASAFAALEKAAGPELPWIPQSLPALPPTPPPPDPPNAATWQFGVRPAQRAIHLLLDAIRLSIMQSQGVDQSDSLKKLLSTRAAIYSEHLAALADHRVLLLGDKAIIRGLERLGCGHDVATVVSRLKADWCRYENAATTAVRGAAEKVLAIGAHLGQLKRGPEADAESTPLLEALFGPVPSVDAFMRRAGYVEVIRRSFDTDRDIETAQQLGFVQVTPFTRIPILAQDRLAQAPSSPEDKLAGIRLGHFAAFYRRAWRANDFMWGRLDASTRMVQILVDPARARAVDHYRSISPWDEIATCLLPPGTKPVDCEYWLVREWLGTSENIAVDTLRTMLTTALQDDLVNGDGNVTRDLCTRAVQLEILRQELPILDGAVLADRALGASSKPLKLMDKGLQAAIEGLRPSSAKDSLPRRLDARGRMEIGSNLGVRTITHALFVTLAVLRFAKVPFSLPLYSLRAALFPLAGAVSRVVWHRVAVIVGFWAAAVYLAARIVTTHGCPDRAADRCDEVSLQTIWSAPVLLSYLALFAVIGVVLLAVLRVVRTRKKTKWVWHGAWGLALLATGGVGAIVLALLNDVPWTNLLVSKGAHAPPEAPMWLILGLVFALPLTRLVSPARRAVSWMLTSAKWASRTTIVLFVIATGWLCFDQIRDELRPHLGVDGDWDTLVAIAGTCGAPIVVTAYLSYPWLRGSVKRSKDWVIRKLSATGAG